MAFVWLGLGHFLSARKRAEYEAAKQMGEGTEYIIVRLIIYSVVFCAIGALMNSCD